ncbi:MAG: hypothetical protein ABJA02_02580 [Acidobacteriota bacterium]
MKVFNYPKLFLLLAFAALCCSSSASGQVTPASTPVPGTAKVKAAVNDPVSRQTADKAQALINEGQLDAALKLLNSVILSDPTFAPAYASRAAIYTTTDKLDLALTDVNIALSLDPENFEAYATRGGIKGRSNDLPGCIADETQAIKLRPHYARPYYLRSLCNESMKKYPEMLDDSAQVIQMAPTFADGYVEHGAASFSLGKYEQAIDDLQKAVDLDPANQTARDYFVGAVNGNRKFTATLSEGRDRLAQTTFETFAARLTLFQKEMATASTTKCDSLNELIGSFRVAQLARQRTRFSDLVDDTKSGNAELIRLDEQHLKNHKESYDINRQIDAILKKYVTELKCTLH